MAGGWFRVCVALSAGLCVRVCVCAGVGAGWEGGRLRSTRRADRTIRRLDLGRSWGATGFPRSWSFSMDNPFLYLNTHCDFGEWADIPAARLRQSREYTRVARGGEAAGISDGEPTSHRAGQSVAVGNPHSILLIPEPGNSNFRL